MPSYEAVVYRRAIAIQSISANLATISAGQEVEIGSAPARMAQMPSEVYELLLLEWIDRSIKKIMGQEDDPAPSEQTIPQSPQPDTTVQDATDGEKSPYGYSEADAQPQPSEESGETDVAEIPEATEPPAELPPEPPETPQGDAGASNLAPDTNPSNPTPQAVPRGRPRIRQ